MSVLTSVLVWACFIGGGILIVAIIAGTALLGWFWARDRWQELWCRHRARKPALDDIAGKAPLDARERQDWERLCSQYGPPPVVAKPGRRR